MARWQSVFQINATFVHVLVEAFVSWESRLQTSRAQSHRDWKQKQNKTKIYGQTMRFKSEKSHSISTSNSQPHVVWLWETQDYVFACDSKCNLHHLRKKLCPLRV